MLEHFLIFFPCRIELEVGYSTAPVVNRCTAIHLAPCHMSRLLSLLLLALENALDVAWNEAQLDTESRLRGEAGPVSELHFTPGNPRNVRVRLTYLF